MNRLDFTKYTGAAGQWSHNSSGADQNTIAMEQNLKTHDLGWRVQMQKFSRKILTMFASSLACNLRRHLKTHSGEKLNKCNQCDFASYQAGNLRTHLKTQSGEKPNKCNRCDFACSDPSSFWKHMKRHRPVWKRELFFILSRLLMKQIYFWT